MTNPILNPKVEQISAIQVDIESTNFDDHSEIVVMGRKLGFCNGWDGISTFDNMLYLVFGFIPLNPNIGIPTAELVSFDFRKGKIEITSYSDEGVPKLVSSMDMIQILGNIPMIEN